MADWRNRMDQITNKVKSQLFAKGVDNMNQLQDIFLVSTPSFEALTPFAERLCLVAHSEAVAIIAI